MTVTVFTSNCRRFRVTVIEKDAVSDWDLDLHLAVAVLATSMTYSCENFTGPWSMSLYVKLTKSLALHFAVNITVL